MANAIQQLMKQFQNMMSTQGRRPGRGVKQEHPPTKESVQEECQTGQLGLFTMWLVQLRTATNRLTKLRTLALLSTLCLHPRHNIEPGQTFNFVLCGC
eukprot:5752290-Amphidinium_carterae.1